MDDNIRDCNYCKNFDLYKLKRCIESRCLILGDLNGRYKYYDEVDEEEKAKRKYYIEESQRRYKEANERYEKYKAQILTGIILFGGSLIILLILSIKSFIYNFAHPEMTRMMMIQWGLKKYGFIELCCFICLFIGNYLLRKK